MDEILQEIKRERHHQDKKWGGPNHGYYWIAYIIKHIGRAVVWPFHPKVYRTQMVRVAALVVAAVEWTDRRYPRSL